MFPTEPAPETIGAYKILRRLAGSGPTSVYLGRLDGPLGFRRVCVLKLVPNTAEGDPRFADELAREASICATLNHPAIVRMFDFFEHSGRLVLVLEHVEGVSLSRLLQHLANRQQKLADAAVYYLVHCIAGALAHAHGATDEHGSPTPIIHRNLHPDNIVIGWDGQVRLTGFGIGKILGRTPDTIAGVVKGAPGYMAPEQSRAERVTVKADIYGVGLLLWSLLSGRRPPSDGTRPPPIASIRPEIPRPVVALLETALAMSPDNRKITSPEIEQTLAKVARPEKGKAELVTRVQSAHATIEVEDADPEEDRRPTIPVKGKGGQTARPAADAAKRLAKDLFAKDQAGRDGAAARLRPGVGGAQAKTAPPTAAASEALAGSARSDGKGAAGAGAAEPITIPVPANQATPRPPGSKGEALKGGGDGRKPALPDRETFGRLYEASRRAAERDAAAAEEVLAGGGLATLPEVEPMFEDDGATIPGTSVPSTRFGTSTSVIPEAIRFGPPPALPADLASPFFGPPPPPKPPSNSPVTPSGVTVPMGATGLTPPGVTVPVGGGASGLTPPGGVPYPSTAVLGGAGVGSSPGSSPLRRERGPTAPWQVPRTLSTAGTIAVSAITATLVAGLWIYIARRERPAPVVVAPVEQALVEKAQVVEPLAAPAPAPSTAPPAKRAPAGKAQAAKEAAAKEAAAKEAAAKEAAAKEAAAKEAAAKEAAAKEEAAKEAAAKEAAAKEEAAKEAAAKEAAAKEEEAAKEAAAKEAAAKEAAAKEAAAKEAAAKEAAAKEAASAARAGVNPATVPKGHGVLTVAFPESGAVYVTGKHAGPVNEPLVVRCGRFFVRVGRPGKTKFPEWASAGVTAVVPCQAATTIDIKPTAPPKAKPKKR
ncbi:serine/threonine-protein kinase [Sorangium sp. So ce1024]|uniref:serine/threonine-protein kinase n=1 Tax=Sorangium sp. So ce1024 TaxID=3133327 RepID=UPI003F001356